MLPSCGRRRAPTWRSRLDWKRQQSPPSHRMPQGASLALVALGFPDFDGLRASFRENLELVHPSLNGGHR